MTGQGSFTRSLIDLISRAAFIDLDGQDVEQIDQFSGGTVRMVSNAEQAFDFDPRQLVTLNSEGAGQATTVDGTVAELVFMVLRPLTAQDCTDDEQDHQAERIDDFN